MRPVRKADNLPPFCAVVTKSGNLNFLEPSGPVQACNGTDLPLPYSDTSQSVGILWTSDQPDAETTHNTHNRQTSMVLAGF